MPRETSVVVNVCDFISKYAIYALVALLPIFFLPFTSDALDFNKQMLLIFLVSLSLFAWMLRSLIVREININLNKTSIAVGALVLIYACSTIFSLWRYGSFWGWPQVVSEGLLTIIFLAILYFLVSNLFTKKEVITSAILLAISGFIALLVGILQSFSVFLIPFNFAKDNGFNTLGSIGALGFFIIALLPLIITLLARKKSLTIILSLSIFLTVVLLVVANYPVLWWLTVIAAALVLVFGIQKRELFDNRLLIIPMFFLALSLFFIVLKPAIGGLPQLPFEVYLTQKTSLGIDWQALKHNPILGSGPGTFGSDLSAYKSVDFNSSIFWNTRFNLAGTGVLNVLGTTGILGLLAFLALMASVVYYGIKFFFIDKKGDESYWNIALAIFAGFVVLAAGMFLRSGNITTSFLYFFLIAAFIALISEEKKKYTLQTASLTTLAVTFVFTMLFIFGLGLLILTGQKYVAEASFNSGVAMWQRGEAAAGLSSVEKAVSLNPSSDLYLRQLSQLYILKLSTIAADANLSQEEKNNQVQLLVSNAVNAAKIATDANPKNVLNWSSRGSIYQSLIGVVPAAEDFAITSYDEAIKLDPNNPYYPNQKGIVYLQQAAALSQDKQADKPGILAKAKEQLNKAIQLKSDYASARYQLAMVSVAEGKTDEAVAGLEDTVKLAPEDIGLAFQLGLLYYQDKKYEKAKGEFERAISIAPDYSNAIYFLGLTYSAQGQTVLAIEKISRVLELNPDNDTIKKVLGNLKAGNDPFEGLDQETTTPVEEEPSVK